jgi:concanavalin A-like lectin/glucanase superfamily protein
MDQDLQDLLALWLGDHDPGPERREALLARLRGDEAFRRAFVEEVRLLGMLRAVQSSEPRWLRLEDAIGWSAGCPADVEALAQRVVQKGRRWFRTRRLIRWSAAAAAIVVAVAAGLFLGLRPTGPTGSTESGLELATLIKVEDVRWEGDGPRPAEGSVLSAGRLRLQSGRLTLAFFSGVWLTVEGPADLELLAADRVQCRQGKLRARVPHGAEGFTVLAADYEVVDLGTEFAVNLEPDGRSRVMVFEGQAAVSVLDKDGRSVRGALLERRRSVEVDPNCGRIQEVEPQPEAFVPLAEYVPPPLELGQDYAAEVLAARPWGYWRFESLAGDRVPNEVAGRPALKALGGVALERSPAGNGWARFRPGDFDQALLMDDEWAPPRADGYAIELWVQADLPSPHAYGQTALVGLIERGDDPDERRPATVELPAEGAGGVLTEPYTDEKHLACLELTARGRRSPHEPCAVRFLDRWPPGVCCGAEVFSRRTVAPSLWRHLVGQKSGDTIELYVDGERVGTSPARPAPGDPPAGDTTPCRLLVGRLKRWSNPPFIDEVRPFEGRLDELAVYDHPLSPEEIRRHARLGADSCP